ncbi:MAG: glycosyltransferase family 2 protein [Anaerolineales bacterium]|nr:glycosyltransferase family 2 protein [Anaerolineales bacterium]
MARLGVNPARGKYSEYRPVRVTVVMLTYIPHLEGYFRDRFEVLKLSLASLHRNTSLPYDLFIFDNGSCPQVVDYLNQLQHNGDIQYLLLSAKNIGKIGALKVIFNAIPGELAAYSDDDILFYPGWLEAHLDILEKFPQVGMVSGVPVRNASKHAMQTLDRFRNEGTHGLTVVSERRIPDDWEWDWAVSTGRDPGQHLESTKNELDTVVKIDDLEAIAGANHFQFVAPKDVIVEALPNNWSGKLMGHMVELDEAVDNLGYLRLSTVQRVTRHIGNTISEELVNEVKAMDLTAATSFHGSARKQRHWLLAIPGMRRIIKALYDRLFNILHHI